MCGTMGQQMEILKVPWLPASREHKNNDPIQHVGCSTNEGHYSIVPEKRQERNKLWGGMLIIAVLDIGAGVAVLCEQ